MSHGPLPIKAVPAGKALGAGASDRVLIASIDSFPASDPPGWIEGAAHPGEAAPLPQEAAHPGARTRR